MSEPLSKFNARPPNTIQPQSRASDQANTSDDPTIKEKRDKGAVSRFINNSPPNTIQPQSRASDQANTSDDPTIKEKRDKGAVSRFINNSPPNTIQPQSRASDQANTSDDPTIKEKTLPLWIPGIVIFQVAAVNVLIYLVGSNLFTLNDAVLMFYVGLGLGSPLGLTNNTIRNAISSVFPVTKQLSS